VFKFLGRYMKAAIIGGGICVTRSKLKVPRSASG
jgi:hypothetical protein